MNENPVETGFKLKVDCRLLYALIGNYFDVEVNLIRNNTLQKVSTSLNITIREDDDNKTEQENLSLCFQMHPTIVNLHDGFAKLKMRIISTVQLSGNRVYVEASCPTGQLKGKSKSFEIYKTALYMKTEFPTEWIEVPQKEFIHVDLNEALHGVEREKGDPVIWYKCEGGKGNCGKLFAQVLDEGRRLLHEGGEVKMHEQIKLEYELVDENGTKVLERRKILAILGNSKLETNSYLSFRMHEVSKNHSHQWFRIKATPVDPVLRSIIAPAVSRPMFVCSKRKHQHVAYTGIDERRRPSRFNVDTGKIMMSGMGTRTPRPIMPKVDPDPFQHREIEQDSLFGQLLGPRNLRCDPDYRAGTNMDYQTDMRVDYRSSNFSSDHATYSPSPPKLHDFNGDSSFHRRFAGRPRMPATTAPSNADMPLPGQRVKSRSGGARSPKIESRPYYSKSHVPQTTPGGAELPQAMPHDSRPVPSEMAADGFHPITEMQMGVDGGAPRGDGPPSPPRHQHGARPISAGGLSHTPYSDPNIQLDFPVHEYPDDRQFRAWTESVIELLKNIRLKYVGKNNLNQQLLKCESCKQIFVSEDPQGEFHTPGCKINEYLSVSKSMLRCLDKSKDGQGNQYKHFWKTTKEPVSSEEGNPQSGMQKAPIEPSARGVFLNSTSANKPESEIIETSLSPSQDETNTEGRSDQMSKEDNQSVGRRNLEAAKQLSQSDCYPPQPKVMHQEAEPKMDSQGSSSPPKSLPVDNSHDSANAVHQQSAEPVGHGQSADPPPPPPLSNATAPSALQPTPKQTQAPPLDPGSQAVESRTAGGSVPSASDGGMDCGYVQSHKTFGNDSHMKPELQDQEIFDEEYQPLNKNSVPPVLNQSTFSQDLSPNLQETDDEDNTVEIC